MGISIESPELHLHFRSDKEMIELSNDEQSENDKETL